MNNINRVSSAKLLIPQTGANHVFRERLVDTLHSNIQKRLQMILAPAGYGKTTLVTDFIHSVDVPACWYSIDVQDEDPKLFLEGILASLSARFAAFGKLTASQLAATGDVVKDAHHCITILTNEIRDAIKDYFIFVLEDYHVIEHSEPARMILNLLLEKIPENCNFIISSRTQVELPVIPKLVLRNQISTITTSHLSFTEDEVKDLAIKCFGQNLTTEAASRLVNETGGWVVNLMLRLSNSGINNLPKTTEITQEQIFRYMTTEVFEKQSPQIQKFLLYSSTFHDVEFELMEQLLPKVNYHKVMNLLEKKILFLQSIDAKKQCYRYHQLFRDFLQEKLTQDNPESFYLLHTKAAALYEKNKQWIEAIEHYLTARKHHDVIRLIKENSFNLFNSGKWAIMHRWLNVLPANLTASDTDLVLLRAQCLIHLGNTNESQTLLTDLLEKRLGKKDWLLRVKALNWRSAVFRLNGYFREAKNDVLVAIELLQEHHGPTELLGACHRRLGDTYKDIGQFSSALKHLRMAKGYYASVSDIGAIAIIHNSLGVIFKRMGQLTKAKMHFEKARVNWTKTNNLGELAATLNNIGIIHQRFGQYDLALDLFNSGLEKARETGYLRAQAGIKISIADILRELGRYKEAIENYKEGIELSRQSMEAAFIAYATAGIGETYRLLGQFDKAKTLLEEARHQTEEQKQSYETALFDTQLGIIAYETGRFESAKALLNSAYSRLKIMGDKDAMAKTCFHLAQMSFLCREYKLAADWLEKSSRLADELGYENFLVVEGKNTLPLIHHGISCNIGEGRFTMVLEKIKTPDEMKRSEFIVNTPMSSKEKEVCDIKVRTLGVTDVILNNRQIKDTDWRSSRAKEIFFYLLIHPNGRTKEQITSAIWPDLSPAKGSSNFHINLFRARQALFPGIFTFEDGKYNINPDIRVWFDVTEFEHSTTAIQKNPRHNNEDKVLEYAAELYNGPFLEEFYTEWVEERRRELENAYLKVLSQLADIYAKKRDFTKAIKSLEKSISIDPYQEEIYCRIMDFYMKGDDRSMALRIYKQYLNTMADDELKDSSEIKSLYQKLLALKVPSSLQRS